MKHSLYIEQVNEPQGKGSRRGSSQAIPIYPLVFNGLGEPTVKMIVFATVARKCNYSLLGGSLQNSGPIPPIWAICDYIL
jgi:hypothetical protein